MTPSKEMIAAQAATVRLPEHERIARKKAGLLRRKMMNGKTYRAALAARNAGRDVTERR